MLFDQGRQCLHGEFLVPCPVIYLIHHCTEKWRLTATKVDSLHHLSTSKKTNERRCISKVFLPSVSVIRPRTIQDMSICIQEVYQISHY